MVTDDERRAAANTIRRYNGQANCMYLVKYAVCKGDMDVSERAFLNRLADLIEPEERTCHMIRDHLTDTVFCDVCGERFDGVAQYMAMGPNGFSPADYKGKYKDAKFCPSCGAKVVEK